MIGIGIHGIPKNHACSVEVTWCPFQKKPIQISNYCNGKGNEKCAEKMAVLLESDEKCAENSVQPQSDINLTIPCDEKRSQHYDNCDDKSDEKFDQPQIDVDVLIPRDDKRSQHYDNYDDKSDENCDQPQIDVNVLIPHDEKKISV